MSTSGARLTERSRPKRARSHDVLGAIDADHAALLALFRDLGRAAEARDGGSRRHIARRLRSGLLSLRAAEDRVVYDRLTPGEDTEIEAAVAEAREHHAQIEQTLGEIDAAEHDGVDAAREIAVLEALFRRHVDHTRHGVRAAVSKAFDPETRRRLGDEYMAQRRSPTRARSRAGARSSRAPSRLSSTLDMTTSAELSHGLW